MYKKIGAIINRLPDESVLQHINTNGIPVLSYIENDSNLAIFDIEGKDITKLFDYNNKIKQKFAEILVPIAMKKHFGIVPSMLQDIQKGKPCEVDAINGVVCEWGKKYGIPTPVNDRIVEIIKKEQNEGLKPMLANIQFFEEFYK